MQCAEYSLIALTGKVITIWIGIPGRLFETLADGKTVRYNTEDEARAGHEVACASYSGT